MKKRLSKKERLNIKQERIIELKKRQEDIKHELKKAYFDYYIEDGKTVRQAEALI